MQRNVEKVWLPEADILVRRRKDIENKSSFLNPSSYLKPLNPLTSLTAIFCIFPHPWIDKVNRFAHSTRSVVIQAHNEEGERSTNQK